MRQVPFDRNTDGDIRLKVGRVARFLRTNAGGNDDVSVFSTEDRYYVLCVNRRLPYVGLDVYDRHDVAEAGSAFFTEPFADTFFQEGNVGAALGRRWESLSDRTMVKRLSEYTDY